MKQLILLILLLVPAVVLGQGDPKKIESRVTFSDSKYPYSISYSNKWTPLESEDEDTRVILVSTSDAGSMEAFFTIATNFQEELKVLSSEEFANIVLEDPESIKRNTLEINSNAKAIEFRKSKIGEITTVEVKYRYVDDNDGQKREVIQFENTFLASGRVYILSFAIEVAQFEKWKPEIDAVNSSFKIKASATDPEKSDSDDN